MSAFVDVVTIRVKAGDGGNGHVSFRREKYVPNGGPDGGDGGKGGNIVFLVNPNMHTLLDFRYNRRFFADNGDKGSQNRMTGKNGKDLVIEVPPGTLVKDAETGRVLFDMGDSTEPRVLLRGGRGGHGNQHFATPTRQAPNFAKPGGKTEAADLKLELKSIADVGLIGFPNVGKSTLLSVVTAARPKIADYHFTTLVPNLGMVRVGQDGFTLADIPGLIEGASEGAGLGHDFLRHVERTRLLIHVLDISGCEGRDPLEDYRAINAELSQYGNLARSPQIIAANKTDLPDAEENLQRLREMVGDVPIFPICAAAAQGTGPLMNEAYRMLGLLPKAPPFVEETSIGEAPAGEGFSISRRDDAAYVVSGPSVTRLISTVNFGDEESLQWFQRTLRRIGVIEALRDEGAGEGDTVCIGDIEFDFVD